MKKALSLLVILFHAAIANAQSWTAVGSGLNNGSYVNTLYVYDSVLYAGGAFASPGHNIAQWNGSMWDSLGSGTNNEVSAISFYKGNIYIGGFFSRAGGHSAGSIAKWNGSTLNNAGFDVEGGGINALQVYDNLLYVGGQFDSVNHNYLPSEGLCTWNSTNTMPVTIDTFNLYNYVLSVYAGNLYLGFPIYGSYNYCLLYWNSSYFTCGGQYFHSNGSGDQFAMTICNGKLYIGGIFDTAGNVPANNIAGWNGSTCSKLGSGINGTVYALASYGNLLFAGGVFDTAGGVPAKNVAMWNGTSWSAMGNGLNGPVYALAVFDSNLYAGGAFTSPGIGIAEYAGPLGIQKLIAKREDVRVYPNPNNGIFTIQLSDVSHQHSIDIYNILGEKVYSSTLIKENTSIDLGKQPPGVYLYRILTPNGEPMSTGKLVIE